VNDFISTSELDAAGPSSALGGDSEELDALREDRSQNPHSVLGAHAARIDGLPAIVVRSFHPDALGCTLLTGSQAWPMEALGAGVFAVLLAEPFPIHGYRLRFEFAGGATWEHEDPYRFASSVGEVDLHLISEGTHHELWNALGSHVRTLNGVTGTAFSVWAPNAKRVSVVGDFNGWDGRLLPMRLLGTSGVWELFVPGITAGALYKYEIKTTEGLLRLKTDPLGRAMEQSPGTATRVTESRFAWRDERWLKARAAANVTREPVAIYEVHFGSWARVPEEQNRMLTYRELAPRLVEHARRFGFTHLEVMPIAEHVFYPSWGYLVTGYYAPTSRYGTPDDFRFFVNYCHENGIGVLIDWVPAHFPKDDFALRRFDGSALYEHEDPRRGEHPDWGTLIFNLARREVGNFLAANALYWLTEFHIDGLRVDAVASMLYLDFSRKEGEWLPNQYGGRENLDAIQFFQDVNTLVHTRVPGAITVAEESTAWSGVTRAASEGGLGFDLKWNMGWMHDTLDFFSLDPLYRKHHIDQLTFAMIYEYSEHFINAISHDEVVYGKRSLLEKMPGDEWQKLANLRLLLAYQYTRPGKKLMFMGTEFGQHREWNHDTSLDFHLANELRGQALEAYVAELGNFYLRTSALWHCDPDAESFEWIDCNDRDNSVVSYVRKAGADHVVVVLNFTLVPRYDYRLGVPLPGSYAEQLSSDAAGFGGSGLAHVVVIATEAVPCHGREQSIRLFVPPLGAVILAPGVA
jgi:1,4-alpha-glucan branching enzyme